MKKGRVEVEKGENDKDQRGGRRERKRSNGGGWRRGKEAEDGDKSDGSMGGEREVRMIEGKRMEHLEDEMGSLDGQGRRGAAHGDSRFVWGPIGGVSQNGGRRGEKREMRQGCVVIICFKPLYNTVTFGSY